MATDDQEMVQALLADRPDPALSDGVRVGRLHRCAYDLGPGRAPHVVEHSGELGVPITDQKPPRHRLIAKAGQQIAGLLGNPQAGRMVGDAGQVHPPAAELDDEQHIHPPQEHRVDGEEVAGHDSGGLLAQERPPTRRGASGRRVKTVGAQHPPDRAGRHPPAETEQLAVDPLVAPSWVLASKPHHQLLHLLGYRRSSVGGGRVRPATGHHAPVPAQQRLRSHQEHRPARPWEQPAERREQCTILWLQAGPWMLATQHRKLVA